MRRQLSVNSNSSAQDIESITTLDLLGEGNFGKVWLGGWAGAVITQRYGVSMNRRRVGCLRRVGPGQVAHARCSQPAPPPSRV